MPNRTLTAALHALAGLAATGLPAVALAVPEFNMPEGVTEVSRDVYGLHMGIFWVCVAIGVIVFGAMLISIIRFRRSRGAEAAQFHESTAIEIAWTVIPFLILVAMAIPSAATLIDMENTGGAELDVKVTGYQWKWHYEYLGEDVSFFSSLAEESDRARQLDSGADLSGVDNYLLEVDQRLVVPVDTKIRFLITSGDVLHAWWVKELGIKKDAIPGYVNEAWARIDEPGVYRGKCAELCGRDHGYMPAVVEAKPKAEFREWLAERKGSESVARASGPSGQAQ